MVVFELQHHHHLPLVIGSLKMYRIIYKTHCPPKLYISLVSEASSAHTESIYMTSLPRAEVNGTKSEPPPWGGGL
jgi:hypothetical protein